MYGGRPPPRGEYPPPYDGRGPPPHASHPGPGRPYTRPPFREERGRPPVHQGYQDHGPPDPYRRSPPRRRYPSPGPGSDRRAGGEYWASGPPRDRSPSLPLGGIPMDHSLVITVGNERTRPGTGPPLNPMPYNRDYPPRHADGPDDRGPRRRSLSRGRSRPRSRSRSPDRSRAKSRARSKSRPRSHSRSPDRSRAKSRARSKSRPRSHSRSPDQGRAKSRARSKSRPRSQSRSPDRSRAKSRARSKSRPRSRSTSRSPEQNRGRAQSRGRSVGRVKSRSRSVSTSSTSSSSRSPSVAKKPDEFKELQMARRRKEIEQMNRPTKSILKKHPDSEDSPSLNIDSPRDPVESANVSREAERFLTAVKGMEPNMLASLLGELREDSHMAQSAGLNPATLSVILGLLGGVAGRQEDNRQQTDIEDEEKFLYGDEDEPPERSRAPTEVPRQHSLSEIYGDTEAAPYDFTPHYDMLNKAYGAPVVAPPHPLGHAGSGEHTPKGHQQQVDMRYHSRSITPDRNINAETPKLDYPPGTGPLDEKEKHEVEEYEKIQDLLKTIGLDLGVTEISKMAARTQERLHGKKPPPKTPTRRPGKRSRRDSSGSSGSSRHGRQRSSHSFSGSRSSSSSRSRSRNWSSGPENKSRNKSSPSDRRSVHVKSKSSREVKTEASDRGVPVPENVMSQSADPQAPAGHPALSMPAYPQAQPHGLVAPNYPPPGYGQYGNYMPYMPQQWPMYPPPSMGVPPQSPNEDFQNVPAPPFDRSYLIQTTESDVKGNGRAISRAGISHERRGSEEKNNESQQKQKVLEEREKLRKDRDIRMKKKEYLMKELETLRKQQGELLRTKRRERDGHKDPLLAEISRLQEEVMSQISVLRKEHEAAEKKRSEIDKVAIILGLSASDKPRKVSRASGDLEQPPSAEKEKKQKQDRSSEKSPVVKSTSSKMASSARASPDKQQNVPASAPTQVMPIDPFEYYDAGNHWCQHCNVTSGSMFDFFTHLHSKSHRKTQDPYSRPWASSSTKNEKNHSSEQKMTKPAKGSEFLLPVRGFYCQLCEEFYGDAICAEEHVTSHTHNEKYKKQMYENPLYEQRRNLDRQAGLGGKKYSGLKRKHEDENRDSKEKEEMPKHSKKDEDKSKHKKKKEEEQKAEKAKPSNKEEEKTNYSKKEQERPKSSKKEEEERSLCTKRDGEEKYKSSKKEEPEKYKYGKEEERYPYRREEEDGYKYRREEEDRSRYGRVDERYKHSGRNVEEEEERSRYSKGKEPKPKYDRKEEAKNRSEREEGKNRPSNKDKAGRSKEESPGSTKQPEKASEKINEPPKIICGPSPAMRAKLRKKSEEATKGVPNAPPVFGRFSWKKKENQLAKEAERVAAEFLKEEEAKASEGNNEEEDAYSKSVAMAKNIAIKLSGRTGVPPSNAWVPGQSNRGRIRPNAPTRPKWVYCKPEPLNTFLSVGAPSTGSVTPLPVTPLLVAQSPSVKDCLLSQDVSKSIGGQEVVFKKPDLPVLSSPPAKVKPPEAKPATIVSMMTVESDVSAPGVPECEQNRAVQVQPPPYIAKYPSEVVQKSEKKKSNLANLFDILYSSSAPSSTSTANKPAEICKGRANDSKPSESLPSVAPETMQPQSQPQPQTEPQPPPQHQTEPRPQPQTEPQVQPQHQTEPLPQPQPQTELQSKPQPQPQPESQPQNKPQSKPEAQPQPQPQLLLQHQPQPQPHLAADPENSTSADIDIQDPKKSESGVGSETLSSEVNPDDASSANIIEIPTETLNLPIEVLSSPQPHLSPDPEKCTGAEIDIQDSTESESRAGSETLPSEVNLDDASSANAMEIPTETLDLPAEVTSPQPQPHLSPDPENSTSADIDIQAPTESESKVGSEPLSSEVNPDNASAANTVEILTETLDLPAEVLTSPQAQPHLSPDPENSTSADIDIQAPTESESKVGSEPLSSEVNPDDASSANAMEIPTETLDLPAEVLTSPQAQPHLSPDLENSTSAEIDTQDPTESESEVGSETLPCEVNPDDASSANTMEIPTETLDLPAEELTSPQPQPHLSPDPENSTSADIDIQAPTESESKVGSEPLSSEVNPDNASAANTVEILTETLDLPAEVLTSPQAQPHLSPDPENSTSADIDIQDPKESESEVGSEPLSSEVNPDDASSANIMEIPTETLDLPAEVLTSTQAQPHLSPDLENSTSAEIDIQDPTESESGVESETLPSEVNPDDASSANAMEIPTETLDLLAEVLTSPHPQPHLSPDPVNTTSADINIQVPTESEGGVGSETLPSEVNSDDASAANTMEIPTETLDLPAEVLTVDFDYDFNFE